MMTQLSHFRSISKSYPNNLSDHPTANTSALALRRKSMKQLRLSSPTISTLFSPSNTAKQQKLSSPGKTHQKSPHHHPSYKKGPIEILPHLYIGNEKNAHTLDQLTGIDCVLNVAAEVDQPSYPSIIPWLDKLKKSADPSKGYYKLATLQHGEELRIDHAIHLINQARKHQKVVLVHCQCGVARSATVVIGYIMHYLGLALHEAYSFVQHRAPAIGPNLALLYQLQPLEKKHIDLVSKNRTDVDQRKKNNDLPSSNHTKKRKLDFIC